MLCFKNTIYSFRQSLFSSLPGDIIGFQVRQMTRRTIKFPELHSNSQRKYFSQLINHNPIGETVKKTEKLGLLLLICGTLVTSLSLYAQDKESTSASFQPIIFSSIEGRQWVERCVEQHSEILWLADANVHRTHRSE